MVPIALPVTEPTVAVMVVSPKLVDAVEGESEPVALDRAVAAHRPGDAARGQDDGLTVGVEHGCGELLRGPDVEDGRVGLHEDARGRRGAVRRLAGAALADERTAVAIGVGRALLALAEALIADATQRAGRAGVVGVAEAGAAAVVLRVAEEHTAVGAAVTSEVGPVRAVADSLAGRAARGLAGGAAAAAAAGTAVARFGRRAAAGHRKRKATDGTHDETWQIRASASGSLLGREVRKIARAFDHARAVLSRLRWRCADALKARSLLYLRSPMAT